MADGGSSGLQVPLSEDDRNLIKTFPGKTLTSALQKWVQGDPSCNTALGKRELCFPDQMFLSELRCGTVSFVKTEPSNTVIASNFDVISAGTDTRLKTSGACAPDPADHVIQDRIITFFELLASSQISAKAISGDVPPAVWKRTDTIFLSENSDLFGNYDLAFRSVTILPVSAPATSEHVKAYSAVSDLLTKQDMGPSDFEARGAKSQWLRKNKHQLPDFSQETIRKALRENIGAMNKS